MTQGHDEQFKPYGQVAAAAWADPAFKRRLLADPATALREHGIELPAGRQLRVVEDAEHLTHLVLPIRSEEPELSAEQLGRVVGGHLGDGKYPPSA